MFYMSSIQKMQCPEQMVMTSFTAPVQQQRGTGTRPVSKDRHYCCRHEVELLQLSLLGLNTQAPSTRPVSLLFFS